MQEPGLVSCQLDDRLKRRYHGRQEEVIDNLRGIFIIAPFMQFQNALARMQALLSVQTLASGHRHLSENIALCFAGPAYCRIRP